MLDPLDYDHLNIGQKFRGVCPFCNATHERSFSVTRVNQTTLVYKCFRVSCGERGFKFLSSGNIANKSTKPADNAEFIERISKWRRRKSVLAGRALYPFGKKNPLDPESSVLGFVRRDLFTKYKITLKNENVVRLYYPREIDLAYNTVVCVEDYASADWTSRLISTPLTAVNVVATLGTSLDPKQIAELAIHDHIIFMWDPDALTSASLTAKSLEPFFKSVQVVNLRKDPKHYSLRLLREMINSRIPDDDD